jgi:hypothetical protein
VLFGSKGRKKTFQVRSVYCNKVFKTSNIEREIKKKKKNQKEKTPTPSFLFPFPSLHGLLNEKASTNAPSPQATPYLATI